MSRINDELRRGAYKDPEELEREIDATRAEVRATLDELEHKLSPSELLDQALNQMRRHGGEFAGNLGTSVKENPVPALLTSIGIAWMMAANGRHQNGHSMTESRGGLRERIHSARDAVKHGGDSARERIGSSRAAVSDTAAAARSRARNMSAAARRGAGRARSGADYLLHEQPLLLGAIGLAAGAIAGAALPPSEQEDRAFGEIRDRALERAKAAGTEGVHQARLRAEEAVERAKTSMSGDDGSSHEPVHRTAQENRDQRLASEAHEARVPPSSTDLGI